MIAFVPRVVRNPKFCRPGPWINYFDLHLTKTLIQIDSFVGMQIILRK